VACSSNNATFHAWGNARAAALNNQPAALEQSDAGTISAGGARRKIFGDSFKELLPRVKYHVRLDGGRRQACGRGPGGGAVMFDKSWLERRGTAQG
jgi:hypothetical protein